MQADRFPWASQGDPVGPVHWDLPPLAVEQVRRTCHESALLQVVAGAGALAVAVSVFSGENAAVIDVISPDNGSRVPVRVRTDPGLTFRSLLGHIRDRLLRPAEPVASEGELVIGIGTHASSDEVGRHIHINIAPDSEWSHSVVAARGAGVEHELRRILDLMGEVLAIALAEPDAPLGSFELASSSARSAVVAEDSSVVPLVSDALASIVTSFPSAIAIETTAGCRVSYSELDILVRHLTSGLQDRDVRQGTRVGLMVDRGVDYVATCLALLRLGAAFVPLDHRDPEAHLAHILREANVTLACTSTGRDLDCPSVTPSALADTPQRPVPTGPARNAEAYVMFTSGSTGAPKGVCVDQSNLAHHCAALAKRLELGPGTRSLQFASLSFDGSILEIFPTLSVGGTIVIPGENERNLGQPLADLLRAQRISHFFLGPTAWASVPVQPLPDLSTLFLGGEEVPADLARSWSCPGRRVLDVYGPTETTAISTSDDFEEGQSLEIGKPLTYYSATVRDGALRSLPVGAIGELCIGGSSVAQGYLNTPGGTAARFVPDPDGLPGSRLYWSGDLAQVLPDGRLHFVGRRDSLLKMRGYRISLSDIDRQVRSLEGVSDCAIAVHKDRLLAFFVGEGSAQRLHSELTSRLPSYQLPSVYKVEELLMTDHHKLDVQGMLDSVARERPSLDATSPDVERMCSLWSEVLGVPAGPDSDLYDLGGHSLLVLKLVDRVQAEFGTAITLEDVLQQTTPRLLCRRLHAIDPAVVDSTGDTNAADPLDQTLVWLRRLDGHPTFYCIHPSGGDALSYLHLVRSLGQDWSVAVLVDPALGGGPLSNSIDELAANYLKTIERLGDKAPSLLGGWSMGGIIAMEMAHQMASHGTPPSLVALLDAPTPDRVASPGPELEEGSALLATVRRFEEMSGRQLLLIDSDAFLALSPTARRDAAQSAVLQSGLVPKSIRREGLARRLDVLAHHERLVWAYRPKEVSARVLQIRAVSGSEAPDAFGWERYCIGDLQIKQVRASHLGMLSSETAPKVAALLAEALRDATSQKETC